MKPTPERSLIQRISWPLAWGAVPLYATALRLKNVAYGVGVVKPRRLARPVVSVGNLSVGGTGKTPFTIMMAEMLRARGWNIDVLSRGYGRSSRQVARVEPNGHTDMVGDEPLLIARRGIPVYVGADRYQAGLLAESDTRGKTDSAAGAVHLLDDGFQHRRLARTVDIVLVRRADLTDEMLPLGRLREPLSALQRADICVLRAEDADLENQVRGLMHRADPASVWIVERRMTLPIPPPSNALAFCAIGDPRGFFDGLRSAGLNIQKQIAFRDHYVYTWRDILRLKSAAQQCGANGFITTEKDSVRLGSSLRAQLENALPLSVVGLETKLREEAEALAMLESLLA